MKKVLSIILVVTMLFSMSFSMSVFAAYPDSSNPITLDSGFDFDDSAVPFILSGASVKTVNGAFGKDADDESALITEGDTSRYFYIQYKLDEPVYMDGGAELSGYLVIEFNFKTVGANIQFAQVALSGRQHSLSHQIRNTSPGYNSFGWNNVRVVYDPTGHEELTQYNGIAKGEAGAAPKGTKYGNVTTYLNGESLGTKELLSDDEGWFNNGVNSLLIQAYSGDTVNTNDTYIDDIKIYKSDFDESPTVPFLNDGDTYTVAENNILLSDETTIQSVVDNTEDFSSVAVYTNETLATKVSGTNLSSGNVVVIKSSDGEVYTYYTVSSADDKSYLVNCKNGATDGLTPQKYTIGTASAIGGKGVNDISTKLTSWTLENSSTYDGNGYLAYDYKRTSNYLVAEFNYYPTDETTRTVFIVTNGNAGVTGNFELAINKWSKVMTYIDLTGDTALAHLYVNGTKVATDKTTTFGDSKQLRIGNYGEKEGTTHVAYIDDIKIYETEDVPEDTTAPVALASGEGVAVSGNTVTVAAGTTVADIVAEDEVDYVRAFADAACTTAITTLFDGATVVVEDNATATINYYTVEIEKDSSIVYQVNDFIEFTKNPVRATKSEATGFAGKAADDSSIVFTQNKSADQDVYNMYFDTSWGTSESLDSWDKSDFVGYLVYEFNVYNKSVNQIFLGTDQNTAVSNGINASDLEDEKWNKVSIVLDFSGGENTGNSFIYVNGKNIDTGKATSALGSEYPGQKRLKNTLRLMMTGPAVEKDESGTIVNIPADTGTLYIDDINIYESSTAPDVAVPALSEQYVDGNGRFIVTEGITPADITTDYTVRVYEDVTYSALVAEDATIVEGSVVVVEAANGALTYYLAEAWDGTTVISNKMPTSFLRGSVEEVSGFAGKSASNTVYKITRTSAQDSNVFSGETWSGTKLNADSNYLVFEANIMPVSGTSDQGVHFATNTHQGISKRINVVDNNFFPDRWNKLVAVYDMSTGLVDTYANGVLIGEAEGTRFGQSGFNAIRFVLYMNVNDCMYADDYKIYESIDYPAVALAPERVNGIFENVITTNDLVYTVADTTVADVKALYTLDDEESIKVYTGLDFATEIADGERVVDGAVVLVTEPGENYYYNIINVIDEIPVAEAGKITVLGDASGEFTVITKATEGNLLVVHQKNNLGKLVSVKHVEFESGDVVYSFHPNFVHGEIRAFAIENVNTMRPLDKVATLECTLGEAAVEETVE